MIQVVTEPTSFVRSLLQKKVSPIGGASRSYSRYKIWGTSIAFTSSKSATDGHAKIFVFLDYNDRCFFLEKPAVVSANDGNCKEL